MPEGGGDQILKTIGGARFRFVGEPGAIYSLIKAHMIAVDITVVDLPGGVQVIDRMFVHLPGEIHVTITPGFTVIRTPDHDLHVNQDRGHAKPEGDTRPDPLMGDCPHLDYGFEPKFPLDPKWTSGLIVDGDSRPGETFRTGSRYAGPDPELKSNPGPST